MSEKFINSIYFHGSNTSSNLYDEVIARFRLDINIGNENPTSVSRILFGDDGKSNFDYLESTGSNWVVFVEDSEALKFESRNCPPKTLQDYLTRCISKIDPNVVIQMNYCDSTPFLIGTRFTKMSAYKNLWSCESELEFSGCIFCDDDDVSQEINELEDRGDFDTKVVSFQDLDLFIAEKKLEAYQKLRTNFDVDFIPR
jgi:hypothetical protein